jgi:hypothetical protein
MTLFPDTMRIRRLSTEPSLEDVVEANLQTGLLGIDTELAITLVIRSETARLGKASRRERILVTRNGRDYSPTDKSTAKQLKLQDPMYRHPDQKKPSTQPSTTDSSTTPLNTFPNPAAPTARPSLSDHAMPTTLLQAEEESMAHYTSPLGGLDIPGLLGAESRLLGFAYYSAPGITEIQIRHAQRRVMEFGGRRRKRDE